jgi:hypothetical protein
LKKQKNQPKVENKVEKKSGNTWWLLIGAVILFGGVAWVSLRSAADTPVDTTVPVVATLSPSMFIGETRDAYQVAKDIPDVLQQLPCFCGCKEGFAHASNYFCFSDQHGAECAMCKDIALDAKKMHDSGMATAKIRDAIRVKYGPK